MKCDYQKHNMSAYSQIGCSFDGKFEMLWHNVPILIDSSSSEFILPYKPVIPALFQRNRK